MQEVGGKGTGQVARRKAFAFRETSEALEEANSYLLEVCERLNSKPQNGRGNHWLPFDFAL
ncbi:hypothetical protein [Paenibacillus sp.]|uniref:hypothetical protein n=1 Tax=Paenibacillus sp. TaxID=58172 RepID=UPI0028ABD20E|nr:hypothetical protein [Paenibacillus sp.]